MQYPINYKFSQIFNVTATEAYQWCTDYSRDDPQLMNLASATREVTKVSQSTIILKETYQTSGDTVVKEKLVQLYQDRHMWIATHISGPNKHSQFIYEVTEAGEGKSRLDFTALHLENRDSMTQKEAATLSEQLCRYDTEIWKRLAAAMQKDLNR